MSILDFTGRWGETPDVPEPPFYCDCGAVLTEPDALSEDPWICPKCGASYNDWQVQFMAEPPEEGA